MNIYVAAYPKSGSTWLCRVLSDALNCPMGDSKAEWDADFSTTEGLDRPGPWFIRRGHFVLTGEECSEPVPSRHRFAWRCHDGPVIFMLRDPRDVAVSTARHWNTSVRQAVERMTGPHFVPEIDVSWADYTRAWLDAEFPIVTSYEALLGDCFGELRRLFSKIDLPFDPRQAQRAVRRQSFAVRKQWTQSEEAKRFYQDRDPPARWWTSFMRKGIAGDWANHFSQELSSLAQKHFGELMLRIGCIESPYWWQAQPSERVHANTVLLVSYPGTGKQRLSRLMELCLGGPVLPDVFYSSNACPVAHHTYAIEGEPDIPIRKTIYLYRDPVDTIFSQLLMQDGDWDLSIHRVKRHAQLYGAHLAKWLHSGRAPFLALVRYECIQEDFPHVRALYNEGRNDLRRIFAQASKDAPQADSESAFRKQFTKVIWKTTLGQNPWLLPYFDHLPEEKRYGVT